MAYDDSSASGRNEPWIQWFCGLKGHEMFCEVERSYIEDGFNLYGLRACVANFSDCLDLILDRIGPDDSDDSHLTQSACTLYGLIHARYIITSHGLDAMYNKYVNKDFGTCPLVQCGNQAVLPVGLRDDMVADTVKIFCPKCQCVYHPPPIRSRSGHHHHHHSTDDIGSANVDGAAFGTTFPHLFLMTFSNLVPERLPPESTYIPRVFGFRVHKTSKSRNDGIWANTTSHSSSVSATRSSRRSAANANVNANSNVNVSANANSNAAVSASAAAASAVATAGTAESAAASTTTVNGQNTADVDAADAAANDDSTRAPLGQDVQVDVTAASPAITTTATTTSNANTTNDQSKSNSNNNTTTSKGPLSTKSKKGGKGKLEDSGGSAKRKAKSSSNGNGDGDGKSKRPKRPSERSKT